MKMLNDLCGRERVEDTSGEKWLVHKNGNCPLSPAGRCYIGTVAPYS